ncbi:MAG: PTS mannose transporter subunit IID [Caldilineaceae bacterium]|nr:PTS mannose transporter subunit IID [Caldilineaceae bacterium]
MVNLVIVSHSRRLAEGVKELATQMIFGAPDITTDATDANTDNTVQIVVAAGIPDEECDNATPYRLGSDALYIAQTIEQVWTQDGVLVLVDLGSAVLNTEMALDFLPPEMAGRCQISNAPLVEGAITAALEASLGHDLDTVNQAAESAAHIQKVSL